MEGFISITYYIDAIYAISLHFIIMDTIPPNSTDSKNEKPIDPIDSTIILPSQSLANSTLLLTTLPNQIESGTNTTTNVIQKEKIEEKEKETQKEEAHSVIKHRLVKERAKEDAEIESPKKYAANDSSEESKEMEDDNKEKVSKDKKHHHHHHHSNHKHSHKTTKAKHHHEADKIIHNFDPKIFSTEMDYNENEEEGFVNTDKLNSEYKTALQSAKFSQNLSYKKKVERAAELQKEELCEVEIITPFQMDNDCNIKGVHAYRDYNAGLNLTDISYNQFGHNKFYILQMFESNDNKLYYCFFKWGRVGAENPATKLLQFYNKVDAVIAFERKFYDKTRNRWDERNSFHQVAGKYTMVDSSGQVKSSVPLQKLLKSKLETASNITSNLEKPIYDLMTMIWNIDKLERVMNENNLNVDKTPLGRLSKKQIEKGYQILKKIQEALVQNKGDALLTKLSNDFYSAIPQDYGRNLPPMINHIMRLREKIQLLEILNEIDICHNFLLNSIKDLEHSNAADVLYKALKAKVAYLPPDNKIYSYIAECFKNTKGPTHNFHIKLEKVYQVDRTIEKIRYYPFKNVPNRKLLWHGSRITNFVGILSQGLRVAPPDAPTSGYMFGKGIYFTNIPTKAAQYCNCTKESNDGLLLLCEVALGNSYKQETSHLFKEPPNGFHSVWGVGKMEPMVNGRVDIDTGSKESISLGFDAGKVEELSNSGSQLQYSEFIVYDTAQVMIRYICKVKLMV